MARHPNQPAEPGQRRPRTTGPAKPNDAIVQRVARALGDPELAGAGTSIRVRPGDWSPIEVSGALRATAGFFGIYLAYAVLRLQELYPVLNIARLPMVLSALISLVVVAGTPASGWKAIWHTMPVFRWQVLLVVLGVVTAPIGIWMSGSLSFFALHYAVALIVFFSSVILLRDRRSLTTALTILLLAGAVVAGFSLSSAATTFGGTDRTAIGVTLDPNDLAQLFVAMVPLSMYMAQRRGARSLIWWIATGLLVVAIVPTQSRGGILGIGVCALVLLSFGTSPFRRFINVVGVCAGAVGMVLAAKGGGAEHLSSFSDYSGGEGRIAIWKRGIVWMTWRPWGFGLDNFPLYFGWLNGPERAAHNSFVEIGMELGVAGLVAFTMVWVLLIRGLLKQRKHAIQVARTIPDAQREALLATMMISSIGGTIATGFFLAKAYAAITLFIQGLGCAVLLGYPYRNALIPSAEQLPTTPQSRRTRTFRHT